jgi:cobalt-precorrin-5B (C1)-methyltransferase
MARTGITTGSCAAAAAKAAALMLQGSACADSVSIRLPDGMNLDVPIADGCLEGESARAMVVKDAGDDPDITHGAWIEVLLEPMPNGDIVFAAGKGVGTVTRAGLQIPVGEPAINPVPRKMIREAIRGVSQAPLKVTVSVKDGERLALKTFNPRLGIVGGISILGTTGIVRPYNRDAVQKTIRISMQVVVASGNRTPVLVPGNIGTKAAIRWRGTTQENIVEVSNEWGVAIDSAVDLGIDGIDVVGHPGKLAKLITGEFYTHSKTGVSAVELVYEYAQKLGVKVPDAPNTVEQMISGTDDESARILANALAERIADAIRNRCEDKLQVRVGLIRMDGTPVGESDEGWSHD